LGYIAAGNHYGELPVGDKPRRGRELPAIVLLSGGDVKEALGAALEAGVERLANVARQLVLAVAEPLFVVAVIEDDVVCGVVRLVVVGWRPGLVEQLVKGARYVRRNARRVEFGPERLAARAPAALDPDALR
jgi:hypothetical protein